MRSAPPTEAIRAANPTVTPWFAVRPSSGVHETPEQEGESSFHSDVGVGPTSNLIAEAQALLDTSTEEGDALRIQLRGREWLNDVEVGGYLSLSPKTLRRWRLERRGPKWKKFGAAVRYKLADVDAWVDEQVSYGGER